MDFPVFRMQIALTHEIRTKKLSKEVVLLNRGWCLVCAGFIFYVWPSKKLSQHLAVKFQYAISILAMSGIFRYTTAIQADGQGMRPFEECSDMLAPGLQHAFAKFTFGFFTINEFRAFALKLRKFKDSEHDISVLSHLQLV